MYLNTNKKYSRTYYAICNQTFHLSANPCGYSHTINPKLKYAVLYTCLLLLHQGPGHTPTSATRCPPRRRELPQQRKVELVGENCPVILPKCRLPSYIQGSFTCRKSATWDRRLYFPSEGRRAEYFFALKNPTASAGFEPANLGTKGQHATPSRLLYTYNGQVWDSSKEVLKYTDIFFLLTINKDISKDMKTKPQQTTVTLQISYIIGTSNPLF